MYTIHRFIIMIPLLVFVHLQRHTVFNKWTTASDYRTNWIDSICTAKHFLHALLNTTFKLLSRQHALRCSATWRKSVCLTLIRRCFGNDSSCWTCVASIIKEAHFKTKHDPHWARFCGICVCFQTTWCYSNVVSPVCVLYRYVQKI